MGLLDAHHRVRPWSFTVLKTADASVAIAAGTGLGIRLLQRPSRPRRHPSPPWSVTGDVSARGARLKLSPAELIRPVPIYPWPTRWLLGSGSINASVEHSLISMMQLPRPLSPYYLMPALPPLSSLVSFNSTFPVLTPRTSPALHTVFSTPILVLRLNHRLGVLPLPALASFTIPR